MCLEVKLGVGAQKFRPVRDRASEVVLCQIRSGVLGYDCSSCCVGGVGVVVGVLSVRSVPYLVCIACIAFSIWFYC